MALYAIIENAIITAFHSPPDGSTLADSVTAGTITAAQEAVAVVVPASPAVYLGMGYVDGVFVVPTPPPLTQSQQAAVLLSAGVDITSTSGNWTATFPTVADAMGNSVWTMLLAEQDALNTTNNVSFADGTTTVNWPDIAGVLHVMTPVQFAAFKAAIGQFVAKCRNFGNGVTGAVLPTSQYTIP